MRTKKEPLLLQPQERDEALKAMGRPRRSPVSRAWGRSVPKEFGHFIEDIRLVPVDVQTLRPCPESWASIWAKTPPSGSTSCEKSRERSVILPDFTTEGTAKQP